MMPPTMLNPHDELLYNVRVSPEIRRMDMFNRARREEMEAQIHNMNQRQITQGSESRHNPGEANGFARLIQNVRNGIGNMLITAGNRIQNPA